MSHDPYNGDAGEHDHVWGPLERSHLAGTVHRKCQVPTCRYVNAYDGADEHDPDLVVGENAECCWECGNVYHETEIHGQVTINGRTYDGVFCDGCRDSLQGARA